MLLEKVFEGERIGDVSQRLQCRGDRGDARNREGRRAQKTAAIRSPFPEGFCCFSLIRFGFRHNLLVDVGSGCGCSGCGPGAGLRPGNFG